MKRPYSLLLTSYFLLTTPYSLLNRNLHHEGKSVRQASKIYIIFPKDRLDSINKIIARQSLFLAHSIVIF